MYKKLCIIYVNTNYYVYISKYHWLLHSWYLKLNLYIGYIIKTDLFFYIFVHSVHIIKNHDYISIVTKFFKKKKIFFHSLT